MHSHRLFRLLLLIGVGGVIAAVIRAMSRTEDPLPTPNASPAPEPWPPLRDVSAPPPPEPKSEPAAVTTEATWVEPTAEGECPSTHPLKANMKSKIFHAPGQLAYDRTAPDRCYARAEDAEADGLRPAKR